MSQKSQLYFTILCVDISFYHSCFYDQLDHFDQIRRVQKIRFAVDRSDRKRESALTVRFLLRSNYRNVFLIDLIVNRFSGFSKDFQG